MTAPLSLRRPVVLQSQSQTSHGSSQLTAGLASLNFSVAMFVQVFDDMGASTLVTAPVIVRVGVTTLNLAVFSESSAVDLDNPGQVDAAKQQAAF